MINKIKKYFFALATDKKNNTFYSFLKVILLAFSYIYYLLVEIVVFLYMNDIFKRFSSDLKVISVGNITLGGTGKTPVEYYLIKHIFNKKKVSLIARGYNNDELNLMQLNFPNIKILAGKNRIKLVKKASGVFKSDVAIVDDGFQHWRIRRDIDIVIIDASNPFGNGHLIPRGILREPVSHLIRADIFVITKRDLGQGNLTSLKEILKRTNPGALIVESQYKPLYLYNPQRDKKIDIQEIRNKKVSAFCAIGSPESFKYTLGKMGVNLGSFSDFIDHYQYKVKDIERIVKEANENTSEFIITTEKDWMRLNSELIDVMSKNFKFCILKIDIDIVSGEEKLIERLLSLFNN